MENKDSSIIIRVDNIKQEMEIKNMMENICSEYNCKFIEIICNICGRRILLGASNERDISEGYICKMCRNLKGYKDIGLNGH